MSRRFVKINGFRGRWVAEVEGRLLAVLHHLHRVPPDGYFGPIGDPRDIGTKRFRELEDALREHDLAVIQRDRDAETLARDGYVGVFGFKDLVIDHARGISLTFTEKYAEPKR